MRDYVSGLNDIQKEARESILYKIENEYELVHVDCPICGEDNEYEVIHNTTRYKMPLTNVICVSCGLVYHNPMLRAQDYYDTYNTDYSKLFRGHNKDPVQKVWETTNDLGELEYRRLKYLDLLKPNDKILAVGCASGGLLNVFEKHGYKAKGIEVDESAVIDGLERGMDIIWGTIRDIGTYEPDIVIYNDVLEHIVNPLDELSRIPRNAILFIRQAGLRNLIGVYKAQIGTYLQYPHPFSYTRVTLINMLRKAGWDWEYSDEYCSGIFYSNDDLKPGIINDYERTMEYLQLCKYLTQYDDSIAYKKDKVIK